MKRLLVCTALFINMAVAVGSTPVAAESEAKSLWQLAPAQPDPPTSPRKPWVLRERDITLDMQLLRISERSNSKTAPARDSRILRRTSP